MHTPRVILVATVLAAAAPNGCGAYKDDGFLHEAGDVAIRVTPQGLIVVDDKYEENAAEVLARIQKISRAPIRFLLNTHHHTDYEEMEAQLR